MQNMKVNRLESLTELLVSDTIRFYTELQLLISTTLKEKGWSIVDLADSMNRSKSTITRIISGKVGPMMSASTLIRLLHALDFDIVLEKVESDDDC